MYLKMLHAVVKTFPRIKIILCFLTYACLRNVNAIAVCCHSLFLSLIFSPHVHLHSAALILSTIIVLAYNFFK